MDMVSHIIFAKRMLEKVNSKTEISIFSILPMLDNRPLHYHRMYFHTLDRLPILFDVGNRFFNDKHISSDRYKYEKQRILEEKNDIKGYIKKTEYLLDEKIDINKIEGSPEEITFSLLSHLYLDIFNNPVQPFTPEIIYPSGRWYFWKDIDWEAYRLKFYEENNLRKFHRNLNKELVKLKISHDDKLNDLIIDLLIILIKSNLSDFNLIDNDKLIDKLDRFLSIMNVKKQDNVKEIIKDRWENPTIKSINMCIEKTIKENLKNIG